jgi:hypothetical protein
MNDDQAYRNLFIVAGGDKVLVEVKFYGRHLLGEVSLENLPDGWTSEPVKRSVELSGPDKTAVARFTLRPGKASAGEIQTFDVVVQDRGCQRRIPAQVLIADAALIREAEHAKRATGKASSVNLPTASGASVITFTGTGKLGFDITAPDAGKYALWLRARWEPQSSTRITLTLDEGKTHNLQTTAMIGFTDWTDPKQAHTKMFAHYGEQYSHWSWYRIPDVHLTAGKHRLTLGAEAGACFDAVVLLPQNLVIDRAAMNLFQNWNYAPWRQPNGI